MKALLILDFILVLSAHEPEHPPGHLKPLGSHQPPVGVLDSTDFVPSSREFFDQNVLPGKPVLFKGAAKKMPAFSKWTDEYLSEKFGQEGIDVEEGKKENRSLATFHFKLQDFISRYKDEDIYLVETLPAKMREEYALLKSLSCGGYTNVLQDAVVWFSSGGTKSVLHYDSVDNINCLFDGTKELVMINKSHLEQAHIDKVHGAFSTVDVDQVDMYKFPGLQTIPYFKAVMEPGDCFFIPARWVHQVRSYGKRNLAVNIWWAHFEKFNQSDCDDSPYKDKELIPLHHFEFHPQEALRQAILQNIGETPVTLERYLELIQEDAKDLGNEVSILPKETLEQNFHEMDSNKDGEVSPKEIYDIKYEDIGRLLTYIDDYQEEDSEDDSADGTKEHESQSEDNNNQEMSDTESQKDRQHTEL